MKKYIDLHIHSNISDGSLSPKEIIDEATKLGINTISIADHDNIDAYNEELFKYAKYKNINIIPAVEISTKLNRLGIHILGYNFDINNKKLQQKLLLLRNSRRIYLHKVAKKLNKLGYIIDIQELDKIETVTKAHIANNIIENPKNHNLLLKNFNCIPNMGTFIERIMNEGCPAFVKKETITPNEAADLIRFSGGKVILAHPVAYKYEDNLNDEDILNLIKNIKVDGIESNYIYIDKINNKINEIEKWNKFANENNLITTIGSDFHHKDNIHPNIGLLNENIELSEKDIDNIINNLLN